MASRPTANRLKELVAFDLKGEGEDGYGGTATDWAEQFRRRAEFVHLRGGESVQAARLQGQHVQIIRVRASTATWSVTTDWRVRDVRTGDIFNIRDRGPTDDRRFLDFLCQKGVAT